MSMDHRLDAAIEWMLSAYHSIRFAHHSNGRGVGGLGHLVLKNEEHVLVVQQPYQVEAAEAGGRAQRQVTDHHRTVKAPLEQKLAGGARKRWLALIFLKRTVHHHTQPCGPLLQRVLLLESRFEFILQTLHGRCIAFAHPGGLFLCKWRKMRENREKCESFNMCWTQIRVY